MASLEFQLSGLEIGRYTIQTLMYDMTRLIVLKCRKINDFVSLLNAASEDDLGFGVDLENNTIFTPDNEIMAKNTENLIEFSSRGEDIRSRLIRYYIDYMPIWDEGNPRIDIRSDINKKCHEWSDYQLNYLLRNIKRLGPRRVDLGGISGLEFIPSKLDIFIDNNSRVYYKTGYPSVEHQIDLDLPLFEDSPGMFPYCPEHTIRDALRHLLNFSYPE